MRVTRLHPSRHIDFNYTLHQQTLEQVQSAKYLGLTITDDLDWGQHISEITCKATKTLGFLRRNLALAPSRAETIQMSLDSVRFRLQTLRFDYFRYDSFGNSKH